MPLNRVDPAGLKITSTRADLIFFVLVRGVINLIEKTVVHRVAHRSVGAAKPRRLAIDPLGRRPTADQALFLLEENEHDLRIDAAQR